MMMHEHLNDIYITERLEARLSEIAGHVVTTVIAPMAYGKTTAIRHWQAQMAQAYPDAVILRQSIFNDSVGDFWRGFCRLLARSAPDLAEQLLKASFPLDLQGCGLVADIWEELRPAGSPSVWWILDDVHLLPSDALEPLVNSLSDGMEGFHLILLSRNRILTRSEEMRLGRHLCRITISDLALTESETWQYAKNCDLALNAEDAARMMEISEGWIGLIYLFFLSRARDGTWGFDAPDVFTLIDQVMLDPLSDQGRNCLRFARQGPILKNIRRQPTLPRKSRGRKPVRRWRKTKTFPVTTR
ncbi:MAG: hypothetical protein IJR68_12875, partial [Fretibacterium sp.]|nr:hypothetical protein [Fretibacterium sp.]